MFVGVFGQSDPDILCYIKFFQCADAYVESIQDSSDVLFAIAGSTVTLTTPIKAT